MRCPYCGDSNKSRNKARGYCFKSPKDGLLIFKCHNCGVIKGFKNFLQFVDNGLFNQYCFEVFKTRGKVDDPQESLKVDSESGLMVRLKDQNCTAVTTLSRLHLSNKYLDGRKVPKDKRSGIYYTDNLKEFCAGFGNHSDVPSDARLLLFETDKFGNIKVIIARSFDPESKQRYVMLRLDDEYPKLFGYSKVNRDEKCYVVEGAIDSLFLDNSVAVLNADLVQSELEEIAKDVVYIFDNEPRSPIIVKKISSAIKSGRSVVIFDRTNPHKDINLMVQNGYDIKPYIKSRVFKGIAATLEFNKWKR